MSYKESGGFEWIFVMNKIYNDTIIFHDKWDDPVFHHYIK